MKDKNREPVICPGGRNESRDEFFSDWMESLNRELEEELKVLK